LGLLCCRIYGDQPVQKPTILQVLYDGRGPTRTGDPLGVNEVLWPAELRAPRSGVPA
jgi:hypothetical protein